MVKDTKLRSAELKKKHTHEVMKGKVGEYSITLIKSLDAPDGAKFLVREVSAAGKVIWHFKNEKFDGLALFAELKGVPSICLVSHKGSVKKVIPLDTLQEKVEEEERIRDLFKVAEEKIKTLMK